ncbi:MAG: S-layer homology domain-containing protein [Lachnospirales bacterium]
MFNKIFNKKIVLFLVLVISFNILNIPIEASPVKNGFNLKITNTTAEPGRKNIDLSWDEVTYTGEGTAYYLARQNLRTGKWTLRGNYSIDEVRVLNVFPDELDSSDLKDWMNKLNDTNNKVNINVTPVKISTFNKNPNKYLYLDSSSKKLYNYDVVVFGFWDSNNNKDLSKDASEVIQEFIDNGGGVIFGHDTISYKNKNKVFNDLAENNLNLVIKERNTDKRIYSDKIKVIKQGSVTTYPFDIAGLDLNIPTSHTLHQIPTAPDNIFMTFAKNYYPSPGDGPYFNYNVSDGAKDDITDTINGIKYNANFYLMVEKNVAFIQTGHSNGESNTAERMVLANLIYSLSQVNIETNTTDQVLDENLPSDVTYNIRDNQFFEFYASDLGDSYNYRVIAAPISKSIIHEYEELSKILSDPNVSTYGNDISLSNIINVSVEGGINNFIYDIDANKESDLNQYKTLEAGSSLKVPTPFEGLTEEQYLHIAAVDLSGNISEVYNFRIWDTLPNIDVTVQYIDNLTGNKIVEDETYQKMIGSKFAPPVKGIKGYEYKNVKPNRTLVVVGDPTKNIITFEYSKIIKKDIYSVEYRKYPEEKTSISAPTIAQFPASNNYSLPVPIRQGYTFKGFYTVDNPIANDTNKITVNNNIADVKWVDNKPLYVHYDANEATARIRFIRSDTNSVIYEYSKNAHVGDVINITYSDLINILEEVPDINCYSSTYDFTKPINFMLTGNKEKDTAEIKFEPRDKKIIYSGIDYTQGDGVYVPLEEEMIYYNNKSVEDISIKEFDGWTLNEGQENLKINFGEIGRIVNVRYYKGIPNDKGYNYTVNYVNSIDSKKAPNASMIYDKRLLYEDPEIDFKEFKDIYIPEAQRGVNFEMSGIEISGPTTTSGAIEVIYKGDDYENYNKYIPYLNEETNVFIPGEYKINILYTPMVKVKYQDFLGTDLLNEFNFETLYSNEKKQYSYAPPLQGCEIVKFEANNKEYDVGDVFSNNYLNFTPNDYNFHIKTTYKYQTYDLVVKSESKLSNIYETVAIYNDIPLNDEIYIPAEDFTGFKYLNMSVGDSKYKDYLKDNIFSPKVPGDYEVILYYDQSSSVNVHYVLQDGTKLANSKSYDGFVGRELSLLTPMDDHSMYDLGYAYIDGFRYDNVESGTLYNIKPTNVFHNIYLVYSKSQKYDLEVQSSSGGIAYGGNSYYEGENITISAEANEGYKFKNWVVVSNNVTLSSSDYITSFVMPREKVVIKAIFDNEEVQIFYPKPNDTSDSDDANKKDKEVVEPEHKIENDLEYERLYKPFISGYPDNTIRPNQYIKRNEVVQIIYNLYGTGSTINKDIINKFSDVNKNSWYSDALAYCQQEKIIHGYKNGTFKPNEKITRAELSVIIARFVDNKEPVPNNFSDVNNHWASSSINTIYSHGIISGYSDGTFKPNNYATRAEFVSLVNRLINRPKDFNKNKTFIDLKNTHWAYEELMNAANGSIEE